MTEYQTVLLYLYRVRDGELRESAKCSIERLEVFSYWIENQQLKDWVKTIKDVTSWGYDPDTMKFIESCIKLLQEKIKRLDSCEAYQKEKLEKMSHLITGLLNKY